MRRMGEQALPIIEGETESFWLSSKLYKITKLTDPTEYPLKWVKKKRSDYEDIFYECWTKNQRKHGRTADELPDQDIIEWNRSCMLHGADLIGDYVLENDCRFRSQASAELSLKVHKVVLSYLQNRMDQRLQLAMMRLRLHWERDRKEEVAE
eukprot:gene31188-303_t